MVDVQGEFFPDFLRIGQCRPVRVKFLCYEGTMQTSYHIPGQHLQIHRILACVGKNETTAGIAAGFLVPIQQCFQLRNYWNRRSRSPPPRNPRCRGWIVSSVRSIPIHPARPERPPKKIWWRSFACWRGSNRKRGTALRSSAWLKPCARAMTPGVLSVMLVESLRQGGFSATNRSSFKTPLPAPYDIHRRLCDRRT